MELSLMKSKAFTLIELLVVMAIIAMMLGVLVPSLARAKEQGREVYCQNNLRQMHIAAAVYAENQRGFLPIAYYSVKMPAERTQYCWDFTERRSSEGVIVQPGLLWHEEMMEKVQQCPSFRGDSNTMANPYTGYNYNTSYIGRGQYEGIVLPVRYHEIRYPAGCAMFGDGQTINGANKFMRSPLPSETDMNFSGRWGGTQGYRHNQNTNVAWCDGSVESRAELFYGADTDGTSDLLRQYNEQNPQDPIGFLSEDNSAYDLR